MVRLLALLLLSSAIAPGSTLAVDPSSSTIRFHVSHALHDVDGFSKDLEGKAVAREDGTVQAMVRAPLASFRSGDSNRDAHMLEVLEVEKHPVVVFRGLAKLDPSGALPEGPLRMTGEVELHGIRSPVSMQLTVSAGKDGVLHARGSFEVSLDAHKVERPALLFVKIADACRIDVDLLLRRSGDS